LAPVSWALATPGTSGSMKFVTPPARGGAKTHPVKTRAKFVIVVWS
jgi:hypothetical protein